MKPAQVLPCRCKHDFQDKFYGVQKRLHTGGKPNSQGIQQWKCTVCGDKK